MEDSILWEKYPRLAIVKATSAIPKVGSVISGIIAELWPEPKPDLIGESERRTREWVERRFITYDKKLIKNEYEGLQKDIFEYINASNPTRRGSKFDICISRFDHLAEKLLHQESNVDPANYLRSLDLFRHFATLHIGFLCERVRYPAEHGIDINNEKSLSFHRTKFIDAIKRYQSYVLDTAVPEIKVWLDKQHVITPLGGVRTVDNASTRYTNKTIITNQDSINKDSKIDPEYFYEDIWHTAMAEQRKAYEMNRIANLLAEQVEDVAYAWSLFAPDAGLRSFPDNRQVWVGPVGVSLWNYQRARPHAGINMGHAVHDAEDDISQVIVRHGQIIDFIMFKYGDGLRRGKDIGNSKGGISTKVKVPRGARIVKIDTYWEYVCRGIQFFFSDGTKSPLLGMSGHPVEQTTKHEAYCPQGVLTSVSLWGNESGLSEIHYSFRQNNRELPSPDSIPELTKQ